MLNKWVKCFARTQQNGVLALALVLGLLGLGLSAKAQKITTFDAPGAGTAAGQGTFGLGMTPLMAIEGFYVDANNAMHGFLRAPNGAITTFDPPGAGTGAGQGTVPESINPAGAITGYFIDNTGLSHSF